jgi:uncharacterized protein involved in exopolysaccharide biosynthesis/cellulose biosynthesis protein BcsQ
MNASNDIGKYQPASDNPEWDVSPATTSNTNAAGTFHPVMPDIEYQDTDEAENQLNIDIHRYITGIWERRWQSLAIMVTVTGLILMFILFGMSRNWQASTTLIKRDHQDNLTLAERNPFKFQEYNLSTLLDTLKLPSSLDRIRQKANLGVSLTTLATAIDVAIGKDSKIINIKMTWDDSDMAAKLANLVSQTFIDRTRRLLRDDAKAAHEYYSAQLSTTRDQAGKLAARVMEFKQKNNISDLDTETKVILEEMSRLQGEYNSRIAEADALREAKIRLQEALVDEPDKVITYTIFRSPLKSRLAEYEWELRDALSKYTEKNPKVIKLRERIDALSKLIEQSKDEQVPENTYTNNTKREEMELRQQELADEIQMREAQAKALNNTLGEMKNKLSVLGAWDRDYLMLKTQLDGMLDLENHLARRVEETRLAMQRNDAIFDVVEYAIPPVDPLPSGRRLLAIAALFMGLMSGFLYAISREFLDPFIRSSRDLDKLVSSDAILEVAHDKEQVPVIDVNNPISPLANRYRSFVNEIDAIDPADKYAPIAILSLEPGSGRSAAAANLALTRSIKGQKILLLDADLRANAGRRPDTKLDMTKQQVPGLYEYLTQGTEPVAQQDDTAHISVINAGADIKDSSGLLKLGQVNLKALISRHFHDSFSFIELPPALGLEVSLEQASLIGRAIIVTRSGHTRRKDIKQYLDQLQKRGINCLGMIVNDVAPARMSISNELNESNYHKYQYSYEVSANA